MNSDSNSIFIIVSLFLLAVVGLMLVIQLIIWATITFGLKKSKVSKSANKSYQILLKKEQYDGSIKKVKLTSKFNNYDKKTNCLKLKVNDFEEKTIWNCYQNLISVLMVRWKKANHKTHLTLIASTLIFYLSVVMTLVCTLIYYINLEHGTLDTINTTLLSIFSFITLMTIVLSWLVWTMTYEKVRKELIELTDTLEIPNLTKAIKKISAYKTLFPSSELLL
ncbi:hypothetical protein [Spiroplasma platyhelix]|uniref:Transmembrane protein n=1 Tax=Spiroplasma platyhelix PALS-1 TaxID=1276218 RepID=A0A846TSG0_9MOLU|nr:hypothetical protein [Spiroplasma platyhelix]MBE4704075.1 hypothetical protein [Spiroplasma platyhelix PALS-1]NKE38445.1 hypothetical protein [Spiroplasma platyhelix PALS-1]UJB29333.1 hypothetical protein SPLAT_v1c05690 [Spiroplasma platyhelix PALS-1]